ncbi:MAG: hydrogenase maturation protease [Anaerolineae bacterium]|nr:hydrogenase maturation protease [Anaerolineae bacterium]
MAEGRSLILGLGNASRRDDGFGWSVVNEARRRLERSPLGLTDDGTDDLGQEVDAIFLPQLSSDLADLVARYRRVIIVDARISGEQAVRVERVGGEPSGSRLLTHDMRPAELVALARALYGAAPEAFVVSVAGLDFDFGAGLSRQLAALVPEAAEMCLRLARGQVSATLDSVGEGSAACATRSDVIQ